MNGRLQYLLLGLSVFLPMAQAVAQNSQRAEPPAKIATFLRQCETSRRGTIANLEHALRGLQTQRSKTAETALRIKKVETELATLRANKAPFVPPLSFPLDTGAIGRLPRLSGHIEQVLSEKELLCRCVLPLKVTTVRHFQPQGEILEQPLTALVRGVPTSQMHEGDDVELLQVFEVAGKRAYDTVDGRSMTVWLLDVFDMKQVEPFFQQATAQRP